MPRAVVYTRISDDRHAGAGVGRQAADCEQLCEQRGYEIVERLEDNDRSAYSGKPRPAYEQLLGLVAAGRVDVVVAWHSDRLWRSVLDQQVFLAAGRAAGLQLVATPSGDFEPGNADSEFFSTMMAAMARKESADKSRRISRKHQEKADRGEFAGGPRAFGHTADRTGIVDHEAAAIRDAVERLLAGGSLSSVVRDWNNRGITTVFGKQWTYHTLRRMLTQPRLAGLRSRNGEIVGPATWPAIIDTDTHHRIVAITDARRLGPRTQPLRKRLLTNLLVCGRCGRGMAGAVDYGRPTYLCPPPERGGCSGTSISSDWADRAVTDMLLAALDTDLYTDAAAHADDQAIDHGLEQARLAKEITNGRARLDELAAVWADGDITRAEWVAARRRIRDGVDGAERELRAVAAGRTRATLPAGGALGRAWPDLGVEDRREILDLVFERVVVGPGRPGSHLSDPARLVPVWLA